MLCVLLTHAGAADGNACSVNLGRRQPKKTIRFYAVNRSTGAPECEHIGCENCR